RGRTTPGCVLGTTAPACLCVSRIEHEVGAQNGGDRAAGSQGGYLCVGGGAEEQGHRGLHHCRGESAGKVKDQIAEPPERILDVLAEDRQKQHVAQDVIPAGMQEHGRDPTNTPWHAEVAGTIHIAGIERRLVHRRVTVRQFVEQKTAKLATISATLTTGNRRPGMPSEYGIMVCV